MPLVRVLLFLVCLLMPAVVGSPMAAAQDATPATQATPTDAPAIAAIAIPPTDQGTVEVAGAQIHYEVYGEGDPLISTLR